MSIIDFDDYGLNDVKEPIVLPDGSEVLVRILAAKFGLSQEKGNPGISTRIEIADEPYAKEIFHYISLPHKDLTAKQRNEYGWRLIQFTEAFGIDRSVPQSVDDEWPGHEAWVLIGVEDDPKYGKKNIIKEFKRRK